MPAEGEEMHGPPQQAQGALPQAAADALVQLRARCPRVHCLTNAVAQNFTANVLLAAGCLPSMTISPEEIGAFVARADALLINLGTFDRERREAAEIAIAAAAQNNVPWVLDPVFVDRSAPRAEFAGALAERAPKLVRLNAAEFAALAGCAADRAALADYAASRRLVVALSGATDLVTDGERVAAVANGHPLMAKVTAMGCAGSALIAACLAVESDAWRAAAAGLTLLGIAGELAAAEAKGPGSFAPAMIDALYRLDGEAVLARARVG
jgi:hydroxyethylthiazole kinase